jgi:hypothetical protein
MRDLYTQSVAEMAAAIALSDKGCTCVPIEIARLSAALCRNRSRDKLPQFAAEMLTRLQLQVTYGPEMVTLQDAIRRRLVSVRTTRPAVADVAPRVRQPAQRNMHRGAPSR